MKPYFTSQSMYLSDQVKSRQDERKRIIENKDTATRMELCWSVESVEDLYLIDYRVDTVQEIQQLIQCGIEITDKPVKYDGSIKVNFVLSDDELYEMILTDHFITKYIHLFDGIDCSKELIDRILEEQPGWFHMFNILMTDKQCVTYLKTFPNELDYIESCGHTITNDMIKELLEHETGWEVILELPENRITDDMKLQTY